ncbi:hypothetical protein CNR22_01205 [Sphingobacteriaceae bacterium]|nr:hypothetical protein CNR22_01205 [Sphingobacteriaceae bacterium]
MLDKFKKFIADLFWQDQVLKEHWETSKHGVVPEFPAIVYDKSIKDDFRFFIRADQFYSNEFIGDQPNPDEIIIDKKGQAFKLDFNDNERFQVPKIISTNFPVNELKKILSHYWATINKDQYLKLETVTAIINKMAGNKTEFGYKA